MPEAPVELDELVDLKMLPAWVNEPAPTERYAQHEGEDRDRPTRGRRPNRGQDRKRRTPNRGQSPSVTSSGPSGGWDRPASKSDKNNRGPGRDRFRGRPRDHRPGRHSKDRHPPREKPLPPIAVKFLPRPHAFENVVAQIKSGTVAYSLFALARLFLEKPTRYEVKLTAPTESLLFQLGENGAVSADREFLERSAFRLARSDFYKIDITETEPIKGSFTNVARCRLSGTLLGPTNHHDYQRRLRNLYEQRFSRRMSFPEYQHKIEIISDPVVVEKWKEDARKQTTFSALREEAPQTFSSEAETERHFRQHYLDGLIRSVAEATISTAQIADRALRRVVEDAWNRETRSPSSMMQELATRLRENSLHIFRHRRGMLFVSPIYPRAFTNEQTAVSSQVRTIVDAIAASPRIGRKELADKLIVDPSTTLRTSLVGEDPERAKRALASDLLWLISAGHVIEFNDGSLDLPRAKAKASSVAAAVSAAKSEPSKSKEQAIASVPAAEKEERVEAGAPPADEPETVVANASPARTVSPAENPPTESRPSEETEIGGS